MSYVGEYCGYYLNLPIFSQSLGWAGDWNLGVQLTLFQPVEEGGGGVVLPLLPSPLVRP